MSQDKDIAADTALPLLAAEIKRLRDENERLREAMSVVSASTDDEWAREELHVALERAS